MTSQETEDGRTEGKRGGDTDQASGRVPTGIFVGLLYSLDQDKGECNPGEYHRAWRNRYRGGDD